MIQSSDMKISSRLQWFASKARSQTQRERFARIQRVGHRSMVLRYGTNIQLRVTSRRLQGSSIGARTASQGERELLLVL